MTCVINEVNINDDGHHCDGRIPCSSRNSAGQA
jgi:hypothetical protein